MIRADPRQFDMFAAMTPPPPPPALRAERLILEEAWALIDEADRIIQSDGITARVGECWEGLRPLMIELNGGDSCGCAVNPAAGPRITKYLRVRARAEGRTPMWGVAGSFDTTIRGCRTRITMKCVTFLGGFETRTLDPEGSPYWSETGYRSWTGWHSGIAGGRAISVEDAVRLSIEGYIDRSTKNGGGCGGKLTRWWKSDVQWLQQTRATLREKWAQVEDRYWDREEEVRAKVIARGLDPDVVAPWHKGKPPKRPATNPTRNHEEEPSR